MKNTSLSGFKNFLLTKRKLCVLLIFLITFGGFFLVLLIHGDEYTIRNSYDSMPFKCEVEKAANELTFGEMRTSDSDILDVTEISSHDSYSQVILSAKAQGTEDISFVTYLYDKDGNTLGRVAHIPTVKVGFGNLVYNTLYEYAYIVLSIFSLLIAAYFAFLFSHEIKTNRYSYNCIFYLAITIIFASILLVWLLSTVYSYIRFHSVATDTVFDINRNLMAYVLLATAPLMLVFSVLVSISNIELMRREGVRPINSLGIAVGAVMTAALLILTLITNSNMDGHLKLLSIISSVGGSLYLFFESILISSIFCGIHASRFTPKYNKDYIIILGCRIRPDGTLYPLVRGRVDKAIEFYNAQLKATGKQANFVPSGGKGSDEITSEGEAMKNYLISKGIPEDIILAETKSTTTRENMQFSKEIIDSRTENAEVVFSTTSYHVFRSGIIASDAGIKIDGIGAKTKWYFWPNAFLREIAGLFVSHPKTQLFIMAAIVLLGGIGSFLYSLIK